MTSRFDRILVVCVGNLCRSPVGEALLRQRLPGRKIGSAGVAAREGDGAEPTAVAIAAGDGLDLRRHKTRQVSTTLVNDADLVLVMTRGLQRTLSERYPAASGKTLLFGRWLDNEDGDGPGRDIPDPIGKSREVFEQVHRLLVQAADAWQTKL